MFPFPLRTTVSALSVLLHLSSIYVASGQSCGCTSIVIPVDVDVLIPKDPTDPFGGLKSNASSLRRLDDTYDVFGVFCQPNTTSPKNAGHTTLGARIHVHQYWSPPTEEFRNYSYGEFACDRGQSSLAIDWVGVGLSSRPANASDVQYATGAAVLSQLARHSAGSTMLTFGAIVDGARSPFDGFILTSSLNVDLSTLAPLLGVTSARDDTPLRIFYPTDPTSFSPRMVIFDNFTKDVGSVSTVLQGAITSVTAHYTGPVAKVVGSEDRFFCPAGRCVDVAALTAAERILWPKAQSFEVVVAQGSGHDLNLDFFAKGPFNTFVGFVNQFTGL
ncbi:hypothetical protein B0H13DRAFT_2304204 [Mycena leptocephala]|nr:hypothetical protein B0H13DRAFT_2304203 [Mycena leptocephala]KAJ7936134.1 hypothetical protein B0H13DRAFT_2304204 [Mycena leptocephala]